MEPTLTPAAAVAALKATGGRPLTVAGWTYAPAYGPRDLGLDEYGPTAYPPAVGPADEGADAYALYAAGEPGTPITAATVWVKP